MWSPEIKKVESKISQSHSVVNADWWINNLVRLFCIFQTIHSYGLAAIGGPFEPFSGRPTGITFHWFMVPS